MGKYVISQASCRSTKNEEQCNLGGDLETFFDTFVAGDHRYTDVGNKKVEMEIKSFDFYDLRYGSRVLRRIVETHFIT